MREILISLHFWLLIFATYSLAFESPNKVLSASEMESVKQQLDAVEIYVSTDYAKGMLSDKKKYLIVTFLTKADVAHNEKEFSEDKNYAYKCALFSDEHHNFKLVAKTPAILAAADSTSFQCLIEKQSAVVSIDNWNGGSHQNDAWQFKKLGSNLNLVGFYEINVSYSSIRENGYEEIIHSVNFLTRKANYSRKSGQVIQPWKKGASSALPSRVIKPYKYKEAFFGFNQYPKMTFTDFSKDQFYKWQENEKYMCGWINEEFKFETCKELKEN